MEFSKIIRKRDTAGNGDSDTDKLDIKKYAFTILKASALAVLLTVVLFLLASLVLLLAGIDDDAAPIIVQTVRIVSIGFAGIICGRNAPRMGWLAGIIAGIVYVIFTVLIGLMFYDSFSFDNILLMDIIVGAIAGFIAGVIGINTKKTR